jgi:hypothetical protein
LNPALPWTWQRRQARRRFSLGRSGPATGMVEAESGATTDICKRRLHLALLPLQSSTAVVGSDLSLPGGASTHDAR